MSEALQLDGGMPTIHGRIYDEQFEKEFKKARAQQAKYDENSVSRARQAFYDAQDALEQALKSGDKQAPINELRGEVADAKKALDLALLHAGPLVAMKQRREYEAEQERKQQAEQAAFAKEQEAEAKEETRKRYLAAGGTPAQFEKAWPGLWEQELARRVQANQDRLEARLRASGQYQRF